MPVDASEDRVGSRDGSFAAAANQSEDILHSPYERGKARFNGGIASHRGSHEICKDVLMPLAIMIRS